MGFIYDDVRARLRAAFNEGPRSRPDDTERGVTARPSYPFKEVDVPVALPVGGLVARVRETPGFPLTGENLRRVRDTFVTFLREAAEAEDSAVMVCGESHLEIVGACGDDPPGIFRMQGRAFRITPVEDVTAGADVAPPPPPGAPDAEWPWPTFYEEARKVLGEPCSREEADRRIRCAMDFLDAVKRRL